MYVYKIEIKHSSRTLQIPIKNKILLQIILEMSIILIIYNIHPWCTYIYVSRQNTHMCFHTAHMKMYHMCFSSA